LVSFQPAARLRPELHRNAADLDGVAGLLPLEADQLHERHLICRSVSERGVVCLLVELRRFENLHRPLLQAAKESRGWRTRLHEQYAGIHRHVLRFPGEDHISRESLKNAERSRTINVSASASTS
jgi:hypothetical protein